MPTFSVSRADGANEEKPETSKESAPATSGTSADNTKAGEEVSLTVHEDGTHSTNVDAKKNLYLYEEDMRQMPRVATFVKNLVSYHTTHPTEKDVEKAKKSGKVGRKKAKLGVILGVYLPTIQHIFGVLMFVRLAWIVGNAGTIQSFFMVLMCCVTTFVTAISMSAIATNGMVQAGGSYFMISRNLGPECGGAVGVCFYLANTFAVDLYILGAIEILLQYMAPELAYFGDIHDNPWNNFRLYGTIVLIIQTVIVAFGVRFVQIFAPFSLGCVIISILAIFIGSFQANADTRDARICLLGDRLQELPHNYSYNDPSWCTKNASGYIWHRYCEDINGTYHCDPYFESNEVSYLPGIPGMVSGVIKDNAYSSYLKESEVSPGVKGDHHRGEVTADITATFVVLCAIYFPSVTGIMTGSNMSGDLKDPQKSIPIGTILAQLTCSFVYLSFVILFGSTSHGALLRDKFGKSIGGNLLAAILCWPSKWVVLVGGFCSTFGAALQCLTSAPRLLQAIARDQVIPFLDIFRATTAKGEPIRALLLTALIAEAGILIASLDYVAPVIDVFFLMCYGFVNLACALQTLLHTPSWRPRFKYYHWSLSVVGVVLNLALSVIAGWYYALSAFLIAGFIYKYVEYKGGEKEWGDGIRGLSMAAAQKALLALEESDPHTKNWRPQLLVLCKLSENLQPKYRRIFNLASQLKAGKGLTIVAGLIHGNYAERAEDAATAKQIIYDTMKAEKVKGFSKVMVTKDIPEGLNIFVQTVGLGGLRHNSVLVGWPYEWRQSEDKHWKVFLDTVRSVTTKELALLVPRNINNFPSNKERLTGTMDIWWIVHDGGMLILLSFLLTQHKVWKNCKVRIFTVAQLTDNSIQLKKDLELFLYQLRISAEVHVVEMHDYDVSAYTVERTLDMEKRADILKKLKLNQRRPTIQELVDANHTPKAELGLTPPTHNNGSVNNPTVEITPGTPPAQKKQDKSNEDTSDGASAETSETQGLTVPGATGAPTASGAGTDMLTVDDDDERRIHFTFSGENARAQLMPESGGESITVGEGKLMRMHTAVKLNNEIVKWSSSAELVIINFPAPPEKLGAEENYMEYLEALTDGISRVLMVRGSGQEVVTIYS